MLDIVSIARRNKRVVQLGKLKLGGDNPIRVQSMTSTLTYDVKSTLRQIRALEKVGCEIVRVSIPDKRSLNALKTILPKVEIPVVADIHFNASLAVEAMKMGVDGIRINPGNIGSAHILDVISAAKDTQCCIRIGINSGSLDKRYRTKNGLAVPKGLVDSALDTIELFESRGFFNTKISIKSSNVPDTIEANRLLGKACNYPIHLGLTEAGTLINGSVRSAVAMGILLSEGIGDTLRVSLSDDPVEEIGVAYEILKALGLRERGVTVIACPTCSRKSFDVVNVARKIERKLASVKMPLSVAVMGCIVNGPGEASHADVGIAGAKGKSVLFEKGKIVKKIGSKEIEKELLKRVKHLCRTAR